MVNLGLLVLAIGCVTIALEAVGTTFVRFCIAFLLIRYA